MGLSLFTFACKHYKTNSSSEFSFGLSCNLGCEAARDEFIVFISTLTYPVYNNWLEEMLKRLGILVIEKAAVLPQ